MTEKQKCEFTFGWHLLCAISLGFSVSCIFALVLSPTLKDYPNQSWECVEWKETGKQINCVQQFETLESCSWSDLPKQFQDKYCKMIEETNDKRYYVCIVDENDFYMTYQLFTYKDYEKVSLPIAPKCEPERVCVKEVLTRKVIQ